MHFFYGLMISNPLLGSFFFFFSFLCFSFESNHYEKSIVNTKKNLGKETVTRTNNIEGSENFSLSLQLPLTHPYEKLFSFSTKKEAFFWLVKQQTNRT